MKTVGERIRQAREARQMSGEELARAAGYSHQSAIGNLENRVTGSGGTKITQIAAALRVPVQWLLAGPDSNEVPFSDPMASPSATPYTPTLRENSKTYTVDRSLEEAMNLFRKLDTAQRLKVISYMQVIVSEGARSSEAGHGDRDTVPQPKAA
jgi:transcriptional regulator with XRE-family HTH domain